MPAAHDQKDIDDFILSLIRDPRFPASVNDIVVECGNVRYQPILDRYIAGEDVPFTEVQTVWRDTTVQQMMRNSDGSASAVGAGPRDDDRSNRASDAQQDLDGCVMAIVRSFRTDRRSLK